MLRLIAIILMTLDHLAWLLPNIIPYPVAFAIRLVARLSFPLFAFDCVMGLRRSKNLPLYFMRLGLLAVISQVVLYLCATKLAVSDFEHFVNIFFTLFLGLLNCILIDWTLAALRALKFNFAVNLPLFNYRNFPAWRKLMARVIFAKQGIAVIYLLLAISAQIILIAVTLTIHPDYAIFGLLLLVSLHLLNYSQGSFVPGITKEMQEKLKYNYVFYLAIINGIYLLIADYLLPFFNINALFFGDTQLLVIFAPLLFPLACKSKRPSKLLSRSLYLYYPLHLAVIALLQYLTKA